MIATALAARQPLAEVIEQALLVESLGYESVWIPEIAGRDALVASALIGASTTRLGVATGIVPVRPRGPALLAMGAATVAEGTRGRFRLGLGIGHAETLASWFESGPPPGLAELEAMLVRLRALLAASTDEQQDQARVRAAAGERLRGVHHAAAPPLVLAALSEGLARLAARRADGVILNWVTPQRARALATVFRESAQRAGRDPSKLTVACYVPVCVTAEVDGARAQVNRQIVAYGRLAAYRRSIARCGFAEEAEQLAVLDRREHARVPEALTSALAAIGALDEVQRRIEEYREAGVSLVIVAPVPLAGASAWPSMVASWSALAPSGA